MAERSNIAQQALNQAAQGFQGPGAQVSGIQEVTPQISADEVQSLAQGSFSAPAEQGTQDTTNLVQSVLNRAEQRPQERPTPTSLNKDTESKEAAGLPTVFGPDPMLRYRQNVPKEVSSSAITELTADDVERENEKDTMSVINPDTFDGEIEVPINVSSRPVGAGMAHTRRGIEALKIKEDKEEEEEEDKGQEGSNEPKEQAPEPPSDDAQNSAMTSTAPQWTPIKEAITEHIPSINVRDAQKDQERQAKASVKKRLFRGVAVQDKLGGDPKLDMRDISIGLDIIEEVLRIPRSGFLKRIEDETDIKFDQNSDTFLEDVITAIETNEIFIATTKPPVNAHSSYQSRRMRVHVGRGIKLHPIMAKIYNADYDGDDISASFGLNFSKRAVDPMSVLFDQKGDLLIDPDFFPWATLVGNLPFNMEQSYEDYMRENVFYRRSRDDAEYLSKLLGKYCGEVNDADKKAEYLADYMHGIIKVSMKYGSSSYEVAADLLKDTYDGLRYLSNVQAQQLNPEAKVTPYDDMPQPQNTSDRAILEVTEDLIEGRCPINFQAVKERMNAYVGEGGHNKNLAFRFTANIAKMFRFDDKLVFIGDEDFGQVYEKLMTFVSSKKISNAEFAAARAQSAGETLRQSVISKVGFPYQYAVEGIDPEEAFKNFIGNFVNEYQRVSAAINIANQRLYSDFDIEFKKEGSKSGVVTSLEGVKFADVVTPFIDVYGNYSMEYVFGNMLRFDRDDLEKYKRRFSGHKEGLFFIELAYRDKTVKDFSKHNKINAGQSDRHDSSQKKALGKKNVGDIEDFILSIADKRTSTAAAFEKDVYSGENSMCSRILNVTKDLNDVLIECDKVDSNVPLMEASSSIIECLQAFGGEIFSYFNMSNMKEFLESEYGKALLNANTADKVGGIRMAMVVKHGLSRVDSEVAKREDLLKSDASVSRIAKADNAVTSEINALAFRSPTWRAIVKEMTLSRGCRGWERMVYEATIPSSNRNRTFNIMYGNSKKVTDEKGRVHGTDIEYWKNPRHENLQDFLLDTTIGAYEKQCVLCDVVRWHEKYERMTQYETASQLEEDNSPSSTYMQSGMKSIFDVVRDFDGRYNSWSKRKRSDLRKDVETARANYEGELISYFKFIADNPEVHVQLPNAIYYDALGSALDKQYGQSEKSKQHTAVNAFFSALSYCLHGGVYSDVYRTDDRLLGQQSIDKISFQDIVRLFSDPEETFKVYDRFGQSCILSRDNIVGVENATEADIWDYLIAHPNVAAAFRMHRMHVKNFGNGGAYMAVARSFYASMSLARGVDMTSVKRLRGKALSKLRDRPGFGALVAGLAETYNKPSRIMRKEYEKAEELAFELVYYWAVTYKNTGHYPILPDGETFTKNVRSEAWSKTITDEVTGDKAVIKEDADSMDQSIQETLILCAQDISKTMSAGSIDLVSMIETTGAIDSNNIDLSDPKYQIKDKQSFSSYFDVRQELNGAKTQISTGVEGMTTYMLFPWVSLLATKDNYADLSRIPEDDWSKLTGCTATVKNSDGVWRTLILGDDLSGFDSLEDHIEALLETYKYIVVRVPDYYIVPDKTSNTNPKRQLSSVVSWLMTKRDDGAEKHNLKIKKYGSDSRNSVTKYEKYVDANKLFEQVLAAYNDAPDPASKRLNALTYLAEVIMDANYELGYNDLTIANCACIADLMLLETDEVKDGIVLRSIEQISTAIKYQLPSELIDRGNFEELSAAATAIAARVGINNIVNPQECLTGIRVAGKSFFHPVINEAASSLDRNFNLLSQITDDTGSSVRSQKWLDEASKSLLQRYYSQEEYFGEKRNELKFWGQYRPIGVVGSPVYHQSPGFKSMLILDNDTVKRKVLNQEIIRQAMNQAYEYGNTVFVSRDCVKYLDKTWQENLVPWKDTEHFMLPMFDIRLNGIYDHSNGGNFAVFQADPDRVVNGIEDEVNEYSLGDSMCLGFKALYDRLKARWNGSWEIRKEDLFPNACKLYPDADVSISFASSLTIKKYIVNGFPEPFYLDYGMPQGTPGFDEHKERIDSLINEYRNNFVFSDDDGFMRNEVKAGQIVGWAELTIYDPSKMSAPKICLAPIIPFDIRSKSNVPTTYDVDSISTTGDLSFGSSGIEMNWHFSGSLKNHYVKMHEGAGAANKMMTWLSDDVVGLNLSDGTPIDCAYAAATTSSRRGGTDRRIKTMETMMFSARKRGYNFAEVTGSFPDDPEMKQALMESRLTRDYWADSIDMYLTGQMRFHTDPEINAFLRNEIAKFWANGGTPSDYFANRFVKEIDDKGEKTYTYSNIYWEFSSMFEQSYKYQDAWMKFHHMMDESLCPNGFDDMESTGDELFLPVQNRDNFEEHGVMRVLIPRRSAYNPNEVYWLRGCMFSGWSFFGEDFSAMKRPSVNGSQTTMEALVTMFLTGSMPSKSEFRNLLKWAGSDLSDIENAATWVTDISGEEA